MSSSRGDSANGGTEVLQQPIGTNPSVAKKVAYALPT